MAPEEQKVKKGSAQSRASNKYAKKSYDRLAFFVPAGSREEIKEAAAARRQSMNNYVGDAVNEALKRDGFEPILFKTEKYPE